LPLAWVIGSPKINFRGPVPPQFTAQGTEHDDIALGERVYLGGHLSLAPLTADDEDLASWDSAPHAFLV